MGEFIGTAFGYPTAFLSVLLAVVVLYWLLAAVGVLDGDDGVFGFDGVLAGLGLDGVPVTVVLSLLTAFSWFACLGGSVLLNGFDLSSPVVIALGIAVLLVALVVGVLLTRLVAWPLRKLFPNPRQASRNDFVGRPCVIRTGTVTQTFGQAEVTASDGSSAVVQVRQAGQDLLVAGSTALIFDYDGDGEFFWVAPLDPNL
ncbi:hypothetical protein ACFFQW_43825 [Umezawaea endophytica]|uniref:Membrane protein implicated in regulation of membrane protease activity n=1 Tax=Umezawaea endophytica TaxID=1654476 RepID=A0A9X2VUR5_9PSEU|nr:hypothetical protein [Umezawaea endophytica]MCS7483095.1 hypothetical protein [Umezawaea endophytica]